MLAASIRDVLRDVVGLLFFVLVVLCLCVLFVIYHVMVCGMFSCGAFVRVCRLWLCGVLVMYCDGVWFVFLCALVYVFECFIRGVLCVVCLRCLPV